MPGACRGGVCGGRCGRAGGQARWRRRAGADGGCFAFVRSDFGGAGAALRMVLVPVGEVVAHVGEVGPDDAKPVLDEVLQPLGGVRIRGLAEVGIERGSRGEDLAEGDEHAVVGGRQLGQNVGDLVAGGGFADELGEVSDL